ncbi:hypothetical protein [Kordia sp.]|uniref:hypothetical protein n=1 Tax=Kordia sp. TaxID=1965332 RepID=UPI003B5B086F
MSKESFSPKILTSLFGFGVYFPARIVANGLKIAEFDSEVLLIEHLFTDEKKKTFEASKIAFQKNYRLAKLATKLSIDTSEMFDLEKVETLFKQWKEAQVSEFLCFSGLWLNILSLYAEHNPKISIKLCRLDAGDAVTWRTNNKVSIQKTYSFLDLKRGYINYKLSIPSLNYISYENRETSVLIHGGGWALGDFLDTTEQLPKNFTKKIMVKDISNELSQKKATQYYMNDPTWDPIRNKTHLTHFPGLRKIHSKNDVSYTHNSDYHMVLDLIMNSKAIISKPGGMTIVDAIITGTPLIYLEPMGENEEGNQILIERLHIGTSFERWQQENFSVKMLHEFHENIKKIKKELPDLVSRIISDIKK